MITSEALIEYHVDRGFLVVQVHVVAARRQHIELTLIVAPLIEMRDQPLTCSIVTLDHPVVLTDDDNDRERRINFHEVLDQRFVALDLVVEEGEKDHLLHTLLHLYLKRVRTNNISLLLDKEASLAILVDDALEEATAADTRKIEGRDPVLPYESEAPTDCSWEVRETRVGLLGSFLDLGVVDLVFLVAVDTHRRHDNQLLDMLRVLVSVVTSDEGTEGVTNKVKVCEVFPKNIYRNLLTPRLQILYKVVNLLLVSEFIIEEVVGSATSSKANLIDADY